MPTRQSSLFVKLFLLGLLFSSAVGCQCSQRFGAEEEQAATYQDDGQSTNKALGLLTPEQFTGNLAAALGYDDPSALSAIMAEHAIALGGVDFRVAHFRNRTPTGQSQLTIRRLSWDIARAVVERDAIEIAAGREPKALTFAQVTVDRPAMEEDQFLPPEIKLAVDEGEKRFFEQLDDLYWRLLSRPPTESEVDEMKEMFLKVMQSEDSAQAGWIATLYVIMASMEYWNI